MKQHFPILLLSLALACTLTSCSDEKQTVTELATEYTDVLKKVVDKPSADAAAEPAGALDKRLKLAQKEHIGLTGNPNSKAYTSGQTAENTPYGAALHELAAEIGRIKSGVPCTDGATVSSVEITAILEKEGIDKLPDTQEYYGSTALREAMAFDPSTASE